MKLLPTAIWVLSVMISNEEAEPLLTAANSVVSDVDVHIVRYHITVGCAGFNTVVNISPTSVCVGAVAQWTFVSH